MKECDKHFKNRLYPISNPSYSEGWREALEWANSLFLKSMHPLDVMFEIQKELEEEHEI